MKKMLIAAVAAAVAAVGMAAGHGPTDPDKREWKSANPGESVKVKFCLYDLSTRLSFIVKTTGSSAKEAKADKKAAKPKTTYSFRTYMGEQKLPKYYISYQDWCEARRANPKFAVPFTKFEGQTLELQGDLEMVWYSYPKFDLYDFDFAKSQIGNWEKTRKYSYEEQFELDLEYHQETDDIWCYLNGQYFRRLEKSGRLRGVKVSGLQPKAKSLSNDEDDLEDFTLEEKGPSCEFEPFAYVPTEEFVLHSYATSHAHPLMAKGAKLSLKPGLQKVEGVNLDVWSPDRSLDLGLHRKCNSTGDLFNDAYFKRDAFMSGNAEYMDFCVPAALYSHCKVLFAILPQPGKEPALGIMATRWTNLGGGAIANGGLFGLEDPVKAGCKRVGEVTYTEGGKEKKIPLWLGTADWDNAKILDLIMDQPIHGPKDRKTGKRSLLPREKRYQGLRYLDVDFCGCGGWSSTRSNIQLFGASLVRAPWQIELRQRESGDIFADDERRETGFVLIPDRDGEKGSIEYEVYDPYFKPVCTRKVDFELGKAGVPQEVVCDLDFGREGWYGINYRFNDSQGKGRLGMRAACAILGKDTREAGFESPYAAWPQLTTPQGADPKTGETRTARDSDEADTFVTGRHNTNPDRRTVFKMMHKMGCHKSWYDYMIDENEFPEYKWTMSMFPVGNGPINREKMTFEEQLESSMKSIRDWKRRFPHCNIVMLFHESGGKGLSAEACGKPGVQGRYRGESGPGDVYWATELIKRVKAEFPDMEFQVGNGSSSCERVATLAKDGLDLKLCKYMGIESKGFQTMPELATHLEAPGMAWALRETARAFGHRDAKVNCCGEYVFRPERDVNSNGDWELRTEYVLRDYLVSLAFGAENISHGHIEDCRSNYYNTNWGAGGHCKGYPFSYPKRSFVAIATLTKALDCPKYLGSFPDGASTFYTCEFLRQRQVPDYAYALWTPWKKGQISLTFPKTAKVTVYNTFGDTFEPQRAADGTVTLDVGPMPRYVVASERCVRAAARTAAPLTPKGCTDRVLHRFSFDNCCPVRDYSHGDDWPKQGLFDLIDAKDPTLGDVLEVRLVKTMKKVPQLIGEYTTVMPNDPLRFKGPGKDERIGVWARSNGSWGGMNFKIRFKDKNGKERVEDRGHCGGDFDGWQFCEIAGNGNAGEEFELVSAYVQSARTALDPQEMAPLEMQPLLGPVVLRKGKAEPTARKPVPDALDPMYSEDWQNLDINKAIR